jgi:tRNA threonylcarbamoyladenosine biosynthesis protein TsaB
LNIRPTVLAIDTATEFASVALYHEATGVLAEASWRTSRNHTVELMPTVVRLLTSQAILPQQLNAVAVALGPGSFTGLRIGLSAGKGLCLSLGIPIVGIPTLDIVAYAHRGQNLPICAILQAGRGRICAALYEAAEEGWRRTSDYDLVTVEGLSHCLTERTLFCGEIDAKLRSSLTGELGERAAVASPASSPRRAGYLAELGWQRISTSGGDHVANLEPLYLHYPKVGDRVYGAA